MDKQTHDLQCYGRVRFKNVIRTQYWGSKHHLRARDEARPNRTVHTSEQT
jgi:hypothetical protein